MKEPSPIDIFDQVASLAIHSYAFTQPQAVTLLNYSENAMYLITDSITSEKRILRVGRPNYHSKSEIQSEIAWLKSVDETTTVEVPSPILGKDGDYVQTIILANNPQEYYCTMFTFLEGVAPDADNEKELIKIFAHIGEITAHFHEHVIKNWQQFQTFHRPTWNYETILGEKPKWAKWQDGLAITPERKKLFERVSKTIQSRLERFGKEPTRFGLIHADLRDANLLIEDDRIKVIDFDDCGFGWYLYDLASSLSFIEHKPYVPQLIHAWLKGYRRVRSLTKEEENEIPTFIMMRRLQLISWIGSRDNETARELGSRYTVDTDTLAEDYLSQFESTAC